MRNQSTNMTMATICCLLVLGEAARVPAGLEKYDEVASLETSAEFKMAAQANVEILAGLHLKHLELRENCRQAINDFTPENCRKSEKAIAKRLEEQVNLIERQMLLSHLFDLYAKLAVSKQESAVEKLAIHMALDIGAASLFEGTATEGDIAACKRVLADTVAHFNGETPLALTVLFEGYRRTTISEQEAQASFDRVSDRMKKAGEGASHLTQQRAQKTQKAETKQRKHDLWQQQQKNQDDGCYHHNGQKHCIW